MVSPSVPSGTDAGAAEKAEGAPMTAVNAADAPEAAPTTSPAATSAATLPATQAPAPAFTPDASVVLGFDYGEKRIGVAVGNTLTGSARPLAIIENRTREYRFAEIGRLIGEWRPSCVVVGLPLYPDGAPHEMTQLARRFGNQLNGRFNVPVVWVDERYTSVEARHQAREAGRPTGRGARIDDAAASLILQQYLDDGAGTSGFGDR